MTASRRRRWGWRPKQVLGVETLETVQDQGYFNGQQIKDCLENGITPYIPEPDRQSEKDSKAAFRGVISTMTPRKTATPARTGKTLPHKARYQRGRALVRSYRAFPARLCHLSAQKQVSDRQKRRSARSPAGSMKTLSKRIENGWPKTAPKRCASARACASIPLAPSSVVRLDPFLAAGTGKGAGGVELVDVGLQLQTRAGDLGLSGLSRLLCDAKVAGPDPKWINPNGIENRRKEKRQKDREIRINHHSEDPSRSCEMI